MGPERRKELLGLYQQAGAPIILAKRSKRQVELTNLSDGRPLELENLSGVISP